MPMVNLLRTSICRHLHFPVGIEHLRLDYPIPIVTMDQDSPRRVIIQCRSQ